MSPMLLSLGIALLGAAILTTGAFLLVSGQRRGRQVGGQRSLAQSLLGGVMVAGGLAITVAAVFFWPSPGSDTFDPNVLLRQAPPAAVPPPDLELAELRKRSWLVVTWGTPSDTDEASAQEEVEYSAKLAALTAQLLAGTVASQGSITTGTPGRETLAGLYANPAALRAWCSKRPQSLILSVRVDATRHTAEEGGYVPWREPDYQLLDCREDTLLSYTGKAVERRGDSFPYEQALAEDLGQALDALLERTTPGPG